MLLYGKLEGIVLVEKTAAFLQFRLFCAAFSTSFRVLSETLRFIKLSRLVLNRFQAMGPLVSEG
jgi:hypothetical protein